MKSSKNIEFVLRKLSENILTKLSVKSKLSRQFVRARKIEALFLSLHFKGEGSKVRKVGNMISR